MSIRVTHQWGDVVRGGDANVRVTRQYIEVLVTSKVFDCDISEAITINDSVDGNIFTKSISESITVDDLVRGSFFVYYLSESITISDLVYNPLTFAVSADELISVSDSSAATLLLNIHNIYEAIGVNDFVDGELDGDAVISRNATESITPSDTVSVVVEIAVVCTEYININDTVMTSGTSQHAVTEHFTPDDYTPKTRLFNDPETGELITITYIDYSSIQDSIEIELEHPRTVREPIVIDDSFNVYLIVAIGDYEETCTENITVTDAAIRTFGCTESITITDAAVSEISLPLHEIITINDSAIAEIILNVTVSETMNIYETLGYEVISGISLCTYSPFIGGSSNPDAPTPPAATGPVETAQDDFQLYYPVVGPTDTITLRGPESDDRERLHYQRINRNSRGLSLQIYADPQWPKVKHLAIGVDLLTEAKAQDVLDFVTLTTGKEIGFRDWRNRSWKGIIDNPQNAIVRSGRNHWTIAIEFEAELTEL